jgi:hypothetical protein
VQVRIQVDAAVLDDDHTVIHVGSLEDRGKDDTARGDPEHHERVDVATVQANRAIVHEFPRVMFALMPAFGLATWVLYRKARPFYAAHLYYAIHFHAFVFLALTLMVSLRLAGGRYAALAWLAALVPPAIWVYQYISLRRVFGGSRWQTAWKGTLLGMVYTVVVLAAMLVLGLRSLKTSNVPIPHAQATVDQRPGSR